MAWLMLAGDVLLLAGLLLLSVALIGLWRLPDTFSRLHALSSATAAAAPLVLLASVATGDPATVARALVIVLFITLTSPVATHMIARTAFRDLPEEERRRLGAPPAAPAPEKDAADEA